MAPRQAAEPAERLAGNEFAAGELLFRLLERTWFLGNDVTPDAIDLKGTSVDRERYRATPEEALAQADDQRWEAVGRCEFGELPDGVDHPSSESSVRLHTIVVYCPEGEDESLNAAHSEIRVCRDGEISVPKRIKSKPFRSAIKEALAEVMQVVCHGAQGDGGEFD